MGDDIDGVSRIGFEFGYALSLSGDGKRVAVASEDGANLFLGRVSAFEWNATGRVWSRMGEDIVGRD